MSICKVIYQEGYPNRNLYVDNHPLFSYNEHIKIDSLRHNTRRDTMSNITLAQAIAAIEYRLVEEKVNLELSLSDTYTNYYQGKVEALNEVLDYLKGDHEQN